MTKLHIAAVMQMELAASYYITDLQKGKQDECLVSIMGI
jgi:hypothetical protein